MKSFKDALYSYYVSLMDTYEKGDSSPEQIAKRNAILAKLTEELAEEEAKDMAESDPVCVDYMTSEGLLIEMDTKSLEQRSKEQASRILAYAIKMNELKKLRADRLRSIVDSFMDSDEPNRIVKEINGNTFNFSADFDIAKYEEQLIAIGEKEKGHSYTAYIDDDGELVVY